MDYVKELLQRELSHVVRNIERADRDIKDVSEELESIEKRKAELTNAKRQLIITLSADTLKPFATSGNTCDICGEYLEIVASYSLPGRPMPLADERCPCCG